MAPVIPLKNLLSTSDRLLAHLARLLSSQSGASATLCTLYYTLLLTHSQLTRLLTHRYQILAESIAAKASGSLLPGEVLTATIEPPHMRLTSACATIRSLGDAINDFRTFSRMWGLVKIYARARTLWNHPKRDPTIKILAWAQVGAGAGYQFFENGAYLVQKGVLRSDRWVAREGKWWLWSSRFWLAEILLEFMRLARVRSLRYNEEFGAEKVDTEGEKEVKVQSRELEQRWWRELYANLGWLPGGLHWSLWDEESSPISEAMLGMTGMVPGVIALQDAWRTC